MNLKFGTNPRYRVQRGGGRCPQYAVLFEMRHLGEATVQEDPTRIRRFVEGRTALREGAVLVKQCGAEVFLPSVLADSGMLLMSEVTLAGASVQMEDSFREILDEGVARARGPGPPMAVSAAAV
jgi:hypothetical protein